MKRILLSLAVATSSYGACAQSIFPTDGSNVGIGTTSPQSKLHIYQSAADLPGLIIQGNTINVDGAPHYIALTLDGDYGNATGNHSQVRSYSNLYTQWGSQLAFFTTQTGVVNTLVERMRIDDSGNIGIGTKSPLGKLDVSFGITEPKNMFIFGSFNNPAYSPVGGIRFSWYNSNYADIQMVRQGSSNDGLGLSFHTSTSNNSSTIERMRIEANGNISIGTTDSKGYRLAVNGSAIATSMTVKLYANWPDYVFKKDYKLPSLLEVKTYIDKNNHLPEMPSEKDISKNGINLGEIVKLQIKKIEELTLYLIEQNKQLTDQQKINQSDKTQLLSQQDQINELKGLVTKLIKQK